MKNKSGFTLMELMVTIAIIGILATIAVPNIVSYRSNHQLNSMTREVQSIIQRARLQAIKANSTVTITFDAAAGEFESRQVNRFSKEAPPIVKKKTLRPGLTLAANFGKNNVLEFNNRGLPSSGFGSVVVTNQKGDSRRIVVNITGNSHIQ